MLGYVSAVRLNQGFGFVKRTGGYDRDVFLHVDDLAPDGGLVWDETLLSRDVKFEVIETPKGLRAVDVRAARD